MDIRYQTPEMAQIWSPQARNQMERSLWVKVMRAQVAYGVQIPAEHLNDYEQAIQWIADGDPEMDELAQIKLIEQRTGHDLYARLQYFNAVAGHEDAHLGLTSADITENVQQMQIGRSAVVLGQHAEYLLMRLGRLIAAEAHRPTVARTHGQPAQVTTVGKRVADWSNELANAMHHLHAAMESYVPRGIKGAVGTRADLAALLYRSNPEHPDGALANADQLDRDVLSCASPDVPESMLSVGQCYPRSADLPIVSAVVQLVAACNTIATNIRLWAVLGHANELRDPEQVGSSAMPHKTNPRFSERVHSLAIVVRGYASMLEQMSGGMWFEGDVSTSAGRRVALPGLFHIADTVLASTAHALDRLQFDRSAIADDVRQHRVHLATGLILDACVARGLTRPLAHELIRRHADRLAATGNPQLLLGALADDPACPLSFAELEELTDVNRLAEPAAHIADEWALAFQDMEMEEGESWPGQML